MKTWRLPLIAYALAVVIVVVDQASKHWVLNGLGLELHRPIEVLPFFKFNLLYNRGISFGLFQSPEGQELIRWLLTIFSSIVAIGLTIWVARVVKPLTAIAIGLIIGGAVGNLIDRVRIGAVVDFFDFHPIFPWVFNVADAGITIGVIILVLETFLTPDKPKAQTADSDKAEAGAQ